MPSVPYICNFLLVLLPLLFAVKSQQLITNANTKFSCQGRSSGYYADIETGCQVYHMCDGLGRQFSFSCPNTTLFQQRMLICDHWYMVNCSQASNDYDANLLIGQRDKPFVDDTEHFYHRTPRPDILTSTYVMRQSKTQSSDSNRNSDITAEGSERSIHLPIHWSTELTNSAKDSTTENPKYKQTSKTSFTSAVKKTNPPSNFKTPIRRDNSDTESVNKGFNNKPFQPSLKNDIPTPSIYFLPPKLTEVNRNFAQQKNIPVAVIQDRVDIVTERQTTKVSQNVITTKVPQVFSNRDQQNRVGESLPVLSRDLVPPLFNFSKPSFSYNNDKVIVNTTFIKFIPTTVKPQSTTTSTERLPIIKPQDIPVPSIDLLPPKLKEAEVFEISTMDPRLIYKILPSVDLQPPKLAERTEDSKDAEKKDKKKIDNFIQESKLKEIKKMFSIPDYDFQLDSVPRPNYDSYSSYQYNPAGEGKLDAKRNPNPDCPNCDPENENCGQCVLVKR